MCMNLDARMAPSEMSEILLLKAFKAKSIVVVNAAAGTSELYVRLPVINST